MSEKVEEQAKEESKEEVKQEGPKDINLTMDHLKNTKTAFCTKVRLQQEPEEMIIVVLEIMRQVNRYGAKKAFEGKDAVYTFYLETFVPQVIVALYKSIR